MDPRLLIDLFVDDREEGLPDSGRLDGLGLGSGSVVFALQRAGWRWEACGGKMCLGEEGLVATKGGFGPRSRGSQLVTSGEPMMKGRHYWEMKMTKWQGEGLFLGAVRPGLDHDEMHQNGTTHTSSKRPLASSTGTTELPFTTTMRRGRVRSRRATVSACCSTSTPAGCATTATGSGVGRATRRA